MMSDQDYVLGTNDREIARLGLQHRVWRGRVLEVWRRAGLRPGLRVADVGCGPGYASLDLSEIVGRDGLVVAIERSAKFLNHLRVEAQARTLTNLRLVEADLTDPKLSLEPLDAAWCRWVLSFLTDPSSAIALLQRSMKPGGVVVFHEYLNYGTWQLMPRSEVFETFVAAVIESVRRAGGEMDIALRLPHLLERAGFRIEQAHPIIDVVDSRSFVWQWPSSFAREFAPTLVSGGLISGQSASDALDQLSAAEQNGRTMVTPTVLEVIARKL